MPDLLLRSRILLQTGRRAVVSRGTRPWLHTSSHALARGHGLAWLFLPPTPADSCSGSAGEALRVDCRIPGCQKVATVSPPNVSALVVSAVQYGSAYARRISEP